jgi:hypothetical protein
MAYSKKKIYEQALAVIKKHNLFWIEDVAALLPITKKTFYEWWPEKSNESNAIKKMLYENKVRTKSAIRAKLFKGKGMELIALYKLLANEHELRALSGQYHDLTTKGDKINANLSTLSTDELIKRANAMKKLSE